MQDFDTPYSLLSPFMREPPRERPDVDDGNGRKEDKRDSSGFPARGVEPGRSVESSVMLRNERDIKLLNLTGHQGEVFMCTWNPSQRRIASGSADGICRLWGLDNVDDSRWAQPEGKMDVPNVVLPHCAHVGEKYKDVTSLSWSPEGRLLATGCYDGTARIWDDQGRLVHALRGHVGPVFTIKWNKSGSLLLSGSHDKRTIVWAASTGTIVRTFELHTSPVLDVDWRDDSIFASCSSDMTIYVCSMDSEASSALRTFTGHKNEVNTVCWSPSGALLASCSDDSTAKVWTLEGLKNDLRGHLKEIYSAKWTPTGPQSRNPSKDLRLCTASFDGTVRVWNTDSGSTVFILRRQNQPVYSIASSPSGDYLAAGSLGGYLTIYNLKDGSVVHEIKGVGDTFDVSWSHDGSMLSACFSSANLIILNTRKWM